MQDAALTVTETSAESPGTMAVTVVCPTAVPIMFPAVSTVAMAVSLLDHRIVVELVAPFSVTVGEMLLLSPVFMATDVGDTLMV